MKKKTVEVVFDPLVMEANTFAEFAKWWYGTYKTKVQASTYESYGYTLAKLIDVFGSFQLKDIQSRITMKAGCPRNIYPMYMIRKPGGG